jgi:glycosyltransferase involved in cell wall biosynthesis
MCFNHARFLRDCILSVIEQTYSNIEIIVCDDASTDGSQRAIAQLVNEYPQITYLPNVVNQGNCKTFNRALKIATGKYVIDLATDDVLYRERIERQVAIMEELGEEYFTVFTNALYIDESGKQLKYHYPIDQNGKTVATVPSGDVYASILRRHFLCPPTMIFRKSVLDKLGGYDESLGYEDFDLWVLTSRNYKFYYLDEILTYRRVVNGSLGSKFYLRNNRLSESTYKICVKAFWLNKTTEDRQALAERIFYELKICFLTENFELVKKYSLLLTELRIQNIPFFTKIYIYLSERKVKLFWLFQFYRGRR